MTMARAQDAARLVAIAGGTIVGRTRLQKVSCLLQMAGAGFEFPFTYHRFGPYSEQLRIAAQDASSLKLLKISEGRAEWGGRYSVYKSEDVAADASPGLRQLGVAAAQADSVELELAVTAAYLADEGESDPWRMVTQLKPEKATSERLARARALYARLSIFDVPRKLPAIL